MQGIDKLFSAGKGIFPDEYDFKARWVPAVAALLPALILALVGIPELADRKIGAGTIGAAVLIAIQLAGIRIVRSIGKARQTKLFASWGGMPTTAMLRHRDDRINLHTKEEYHQIFRRTGFVIPTAEEERADPDAADRRYEAAVDELRRRAKAKGVKAVHRENIGYGMARNLYRLRAFGLSMCAASIITLGLKVWFRGDLNPTPGEIGVFSILAVIGIAWISGCTPRMVRDSAESYAYNLFEAADGLMPAKRAPKKKGKQAEEA